jgi:hypothetical protein
MIVIYFSLIIFKLKFFIYQIWSLFFILLFILFEIIYEIVIIIILISSSFKFFYLLDLIFFRESLLNNKYFFGYAFKFWRIVFNLSIIFFYLLYRIFKNIKILFSANISNMCKHNHINVPSCEIKYIYLRLSFIFLILFLVIIYGFFIY